MKNLIKASSKVKQDWTIQEYFSFEFEIYEQLRFIRILRNNLTYFKKEFCLAVDNLQVHWKEWTTEEFKEDIEELDRAYSEDRISILKYHLVLHELLIHYINEVCNLLTLKQVVDPDKLMIQNKN